MPPHLHPRSRFTSSLFATTLFASFFVVALPHALPCPAPRVVRADGEMPDGTPRRRRKRKIVESEEGEPVISKGIRAGEGCNEDSGSSLQTSMPKRECPVPKPGGLMGEILGFKPSSSDGKGAKPP